MTGKKFMILTAALMLCGSAVQAGPSFDELMRRAEEAKTLEVRLDNWKLAAEATKDEKKLLALCDDGIRLARKIGMFGDAVFFTKVKKELSILTPEQKLDAEYDYLIAQEKPKNPPRPGTVKTKSKFMYENYIDEWIEPKMATSEPTLADRWFEFMKKPDLPQKYQMEALRQIGRYYERNEEPQKMFETWDRLLTYPLADYERIDLLLKYADKRLAHLEADVAVKYLNKVLEIKHLAPARHGQINLRLVSAKSKGFGFYYKADKETQAEIDKICYDTMKLKDKASYCQALSMLVDAAKRVNDNKKVIELVDKYCTEDNKLLDMGTWAGLKRNQARAYRDMNRLDDAIPIYEKLWKYKIDQANLCMELGNVYYLHGDYMEGIAMYDEALILLRGDDSARPRQCKGWINRLRWFATGKRTLDQLYLAHAKRVNAEAKAKGLPPVLEEIRIDDLRPFEDKAAKKAKEKKPETLSELMKRDDSKDLLEEGLDLGD